MDVSEHILSNRYLLEVFRAFVLHTKVNRENCKVTREFVKYFMNLMGRETSVFLLLFQLGGLCDRYVGEEEENKQPQVTIPNALLRAEEVLQNWYCANDEQMQEKVLGCLEGLIDEITPAANRLFVTTFKRMLVLKVTFSTQLVGKIWRLLLLGEKDAWGGIGEEIFAFASFFEHLQFRDAFPTDLDKHVMIELLRRIPDGYLTKLKKQEILNRTGEEFEWTSRAVLVLMNEYDFDWNMNIFLRVGGGMEEDKAVRAVFHRLLVSFAFSINQQVEEQAKEQMFERLKSFFPIQRETIAPKTKRPKVEKKNSSFLCAALMELSSFMASVLGQNETVKNEDEALVAFLIGLGDLLCDAVVEEAHLNERRPSLSVLTSVLRFKHVRSSIRKTTAVKWPLENVGETVAECVARLSSEATRGEGKGECIAFIRAVCFSFRRFAPQISNRGFLALVSET